MRTPISIALSALLAVAIVGCSNQEPKNSSESTPSAQTQDGAPPAFVNESGELECPVTGEKIASVDKAAGYQDWNGKRYYFCCSMCPDKFKADPEKYAVRHEHEPM